MEETEATIDITPRLFSDSVELMNAYIERMRFEKDFDRIPNIMSRFNDRIFKPSAVSKDQLRQLAVYATDMIYRFATELEVRDAYTVVYFKQVVAPLMKSLQEQGIKIFFVIDNELREDRFELAVMLYELSGAVVITPYDGKQTVSLEAVEDQLKTFIAREENIVYIEKNASVNYIEKVMRMATESKYIGIFRNQAPPSKRILAL